MEDAGAAFVLTLDPLPVLPHAPGRLGLDLSEDVRMACDELRVHSASRRLEAARAALLEQEREEVRLEEQIADLVEQLGVVTCEGGVGDLVGLLDGVRHDRLRGLLAIPRAVAAKPFGQLLKLDERVADRASGAH